MSRTVGGHFGGELVYGAHEAAPGAWLCADLLGSLPAYAFLRDVLKGGSCHADILPKLTPKVNGRDLLPTAICTDDMYKVCVSTIIDF